jgi:hypothetical protein
MLQAEREKVGQEPEYQIGYKANIYKARVKSYKVKGRTWTEIAKQLQS